MNRHIDETRLNDYLEGLVTEDIARQVDVHLAECEVCSGRLEALTLLLSELAGLPGDATPARDLWSDVRAEIGAEQGHHEEETQDTVADDGVAIPIWRGRSDRTRRFSFSAAQLVAASVVLTLLAGGSVWMALTGGANQNTADATDISPVAGTLGELGNILPITQAATTEYRQAIARLESLLEQGRDQLDPETVAIIEASLATIDRAIGEARHALEDDPNNPVLNRLLIKNQHAKLRVLRQASAAVQI